MRIRLGAADVEVRRDVASIARAAVSAPAPKHSSTFHSLRRTYASLRCACGDDVRYTADQLGHEDPRLTLRVYAQATKRRNRLAKPQRDAYDKAIEWAVMGTGADLDIEALPNSATKNLA